MKDNNYMKTSEIRISQFFGNAKDGNYTYGIQKNCKVRTLFGISVEKLTKAQRETWKNAQIKLFKLNAKVRPKPEKTETVTPKPDEIKIQPLIGNKLRDIFRFDNLKQTADAFSTSPENLTNLNTGKAGDGLQNAFRAIIAFAEAHPVKKRKAILRKIDFEKMFPNV